MTSDAQFTIPFTIQRDLLRGWWFFPLRPKSKVPVTAHGVHDSASTPEELSQMAAKYPGCGWGLDAGRSRLLIVDLDGEEGLETWAERYAEMPRTRTSRTGSGGTHLLYTDLQGLARNTAKKLGPGIDTRGRGGYIVVPPSIHPNGTPYTWIDMRPPVRAPKPLLRLVNPPTLPHKREPRLRVEEESPTARRILDEECDPIAKAGEGTRNDALYRGACRLLTLAFGGTMGVRTACNALLDAAIAAGLSEAEAHSTINSALRFAELHPRELGRKA